MHVIENDTEVRNISEVNGIGGMLRLVWNQTYPLFVEPHSGPMLKLCFIMLALFSIGQGQALWLPQFLVLLQQHFDKDKTFCEVVGARSEPSYNVTTEA